MRFTILIGVFTILFSACKQDQGPRSPNVILIYADDLGYGELGSYGQSMIETPHLDRLAKEGMRFTQFYSGAPVCAPARCILLTGRHSGNAAIRGNDEAGHRGDVWNFLAMAADPYLEGQAPLPESVRLFPELLQDKGYATGMVGKWGLGHPLSGSIPTTKGFDYFYGYNCQRQAHTLSPLHLWENDQKVLLRNDTLITHRGLPMELDSLDPGSYARYLEQADYAPELMASKMLDFVEQNKDSSFFLYWATPIPHMPLQAPQDWVAYYHDKFGEEDPYTGRKKRGGYFPSRYPKATYAAMISYMDENVGRLLKKLEELELDENTIILFTSDNGPTYVDGTYAPWFESGGPFKSERGWGKGFLREGGIRVPLIANWPGHIPSNSESDHMGSAQDVMATIFDLLNMKMPLEHDGISFASTLLDQDIEQEKHEYLYWEFPEYGGQRALRWDNWKAYNENLKSGDTTIYLYNLDNDIREQNDIADQHPDKIKFAKEVFIKEHTTSDNPKWQYEVLDGIPHSGAKRATE